MTQTAMDSLAQGSPPISDEIKAWLEQAGLEQYAEVFIREKISVESLAYLEESHLKELGLGVGDRVKFKMSLDNLKRNPTTPAIGPSGTATPAKAIKEGTPSPRESPRDSPSNSPHNPVVTPSKSIPITPTPQPTSVQVASSAPAMPTKPDILPARRNTDVKLSSSSGSVPSSSPIRKSNSVSGSPVRQQSVDRQKSATANTASPLKKSTPSPQPVVVAPADFSPSETEEYQCKIVVIGHPATGKTSLVRRFAYGTFERTYKQTIGVDFEVKTIQWSPTISIAVQLWDIAGQERFNTVVPQFYRSAAAALVVFDVTDESTLQAALRWNEHLQKHEILQSGKNIPVMLVANKSDLLTDDKPLPDLDTICKENQMFKWWLTSAKTNAGVNEAVNCLIETILSDNGIDTKEETETVDLAKPKATTKNSSDCCS